MGTRGRKSAAALEIAARPVEIVPRQRAPHDLTDEECEVWQAVVDTEPADWFTASTVPILAQYCRHVVQSRRVAELIEKATSDKELDIKDYDRLLKIQQRESASIKALATSMRITNQATINHRGNKKTNKAAKKPWEG